MLISSLRIILSKNSLESVLFLSVTILSIPCTCQVLVEILYQYSSQLLFNNINKKDRERYFPFISVVFNFV